MLPLYLLIVEIVARDETLSENKFLEEINQCLAYLLRSCLSVFFFTFIIRNF